MDPALIKMSNNTNAHNIRHHAVSQKQEEEGLITGDDSKRVDKTHAPPLVHHLERKTNKELEDEIENDMSVTAQKEDE
jgi:hypothetical protein